jgi:hypothetical protein
MRCKRAYRGTSLVRSSTPLGPAWMCQAWHDGSAGLSISLSLSLSLCRSLSLSLSFSLSLAVSFFLSLSLSLALSIPRALSLARSPSLSRPPPPTMSLRSRTLLFNGWLWCDTYVYRFEGCTTRISRYAWLYLHTICATWEDFHRSYDKTGSNRWNKSI